MFKHSLFPGGLLATGALLGALAFACSSSSQSNSPSQSTSPNAPGAIAADGGASDAESGNACDRMQRQCEACGDDTAKQACATGLAGYRAMGDAGVAACQSVLDLKTYSQEQKPCRNACTNLKQDFCEGCENADLKRRCSEVVTANDLDKCSQVWGRFANGAAQCCPLQRPPEIPDSVCTLEP